MNEVKLQEKLLEVIKKDYSYYKNPYLTIDSLNFLLYLDDGEDNRSIEKSYDVDLNINFGDDSSHHELNLLINSSWSWDFIQGYFSGWLACLDNVTNK